MATIRKFGLLDQGQERSTEECDAKVVCLSLDAEKFLQLNSYGSQHRVNVGARSQNMRLSKEAFLQLMEIGRKHFGLDK
jgi:hypothetical protein